MNLFKGQEELDLTDGDILKPLVYLSLPIIITNLLQTAYNLADTFWLGRYSTDALAAISFGFPMVFLLISLGMGLSVAGSILVAQHTGAAETEKQSMRPLRRSRLLLSARCCLACRLTRSSVRFFTFWERHRVFSGARRLTCRYSHSDCCLCSVSLYLFR